MPVILVTSLSDMPEQVRLRQPSHLVTLLSPEHMIETFDGFPAGRHLRLGLNDIAAVEDGTSPPEAGHVRQLLTFARGWDGSTPMLIHCWAGVSRSMASAYTVLCDRLGPGHEMMLAREMRLRAPHAAPNRLIVRLADDALGRGGEMVGAVEAMGSADESAEGFPVELPLIFGPP
jgi:predicted protein tyrosine phosphatase